MCPRGNHSSPDEAVSLDTGTCPCLLYGGVLPFRTNCKSSSALTGSHMKHKFSSEHGRPVSHIVCRENESFHYVSRKIRFPSQPSPSFISQKCCMYTPSRLRYTAVKSGICTLRICYATPQCGVCIPRISYATPQEKLVCSTYTP